MNRAERGCTAPTFVAGTETAELTSIVTGRRRSLFADDMAASRADVAGKIGKRRDSGFHDIGIRHGMVGRHRPDSD